MTVFARNTDEHRPWSVIFSAMHVLSDAGVTSADAYRVLRVEALAVSTDESGDVIIPDARRPRMPAGASRSDPGPLCRLDGRDDPTQD